MKKLALITLLGVLFWQGVVIAGSQETARRLQAAGDILPLQQLLEIVLQKTPGRVLQVELEAQSTPPVYELEILDENGVVWEYELDARSGKVLDLEQED